MILQGATTLGQSRPRSNDNEGALRIPQRSRTRASPADGLMTFPRHSLWGRSYCSAEMLSVYSTASPDWAGFY